MSVRPFASRLCFAALSLVLAGSVGAQSFFEGFEPGPATPGLSGAVPVGWTSVNDSPGGPGAFPDWLVRNDGGGTAFPAFGGSAYAYATFNSSTGANDISNYLISPLVTFNNGDTISFYTSTVVTLFPDRLRLVFNTNGSLLPASFTNVLLTVNPTLTVGGYPTTWTQFTATISGLNGPTAGRFAFHYNPTNGGPLGFNSDYVGVDDVAYTAAGSALATNTTLGAGCGAVYSSLYQQFSDAAAASAALQGNVLLLTATPNGYATSWLPGSAPALFVPPVAPTTLATGLSGSVALGPSVPFPTPYGAQSTLQVTAYGIIGFGPVAQDYPNGSPLFPSATTFLNSVNGGIYSWHNFNVPEGGSVLSEEIGGVLYITYSNVESYSFPLLISNPSTLQFQLDLTSGEVRIVWLSIDTDTSSLFGSAHLVGVTAPGVSLDAGSVDLSSGPFVTAAADVPPLSLAAANTPIQGAGASSWNLVASNLPSGIGVDIVGLADPGITNLALFGLGQSGCQLRATLDVTGAFLAGGQHSWGLPIPGGAPSLVGVSLFTQSAVLPFTANLAATQTTNGVKGTIGTF